MAEQQASSPTYPRLQARSLWKSFPGVQALADVDFELRCDEIHAVVGENGAGKSTLMNVLSGVLIADKGEILLDGQPVHPATPKEAFDLGISIVHQETSLCSNLSVAENIFVHSIPATLGGFVNFKRLFDETEELLRQFDVKIPPQTLVKELGIAQQQLVEIIKASVCKCKVLILDEPTSTLAPHEEAILFEQVRQMKRRGTSIIYISHKLREVFELTDRVTVLKDGRLIGTKITKLSDSHEIISMMVGRDLSQFYPQKGQKTGNPILHVSNLSRLPMLKDISFTLHEGEILGVAGLVGAGRTEMALAVFGADSLAEGEINVMGHRVHKMTPLRAIELGIGYLPEDRRLMGLFTGMDIRANVISAHLPDFAGRFFMNPQMEKSEAERFVQALSIRTSGIMQKVLTLSGGNQQKVVVSKWLSIAPKILIVDEPTRGIDVGAKAEIYSLLRNLANEGVAIMMISSELPEVLGMSDRIMVMHEGKVMGFLSGENATEDTVISLAVGSEASQKKNTASIERNEQQ